MTSTVSSSSVATTEPSRRKFRSPRLRPSVSRFPRLRKSPANNTFSSNSHSHGATKNPVHPTLRNDPHYHADNDNDDDNDDDRESLVPSILQSVTTLPSHSSHAQQNSRQHRHRYYQRHHQPEVDDEDDPLILESRLRVPSRTSLRFALHPNLHSTSVHPHLAHLFRLILHPVATHPPLTLYLSSFEPAANALHSLLVLAARNPLPISLHNALLFAAIHPHASTISSANRAGNIHPDRHSSVATATMENADSRSSRKRRNSTGTGVNSLKDSVALHYVRAVAACPPRVSRELYRAMVTSYPPEKFDRVALIASLAAFYSSLVSLLGFVNNNDTLLQSTNVDDHAFERPHPLFIVDHSEVSAPSSTSSPSPPSSPDCASPLSSPTVTRPTRQRMHFHVSDALRIRVAAHSSRHMQRSPWLSTFPTARRSQLDFVRRRLGFVPRYLDSMTSCTQRMVFMYIIFDILLNESPAGVSIAVKQISCFILARATENATLTAHSAFTAHHYGADIRQMLAALDIDYLKAKHRLSMARKRSNLQGDLISVGKSVSSSLSSSSPLRGVEVAQCGTALPGETDRWPADERPVRRRPRYRSLLFSALKQSRKGNSLREVESTSSVEQKPTVTDESANHNATERLLARASEIDELSDSESSLSDGSTGRGGDLRLEQGRFDNNFNRVDDLDLQLAADGLRNVQRVHEIEAGNLFDVANDNPAVPDVAGLNVLGGADGLDENESCTDGFTLESTPFAGSRERWRRGEPFFRRCRDFDETDDYVSNYTANGRGGARDLWSVNESEDDESSYSEGKGINAESRHGGSMFTEREVALLLVAHEVGHAWRRNWRRCEKIAGAQPLGLLPAELARDVQRLFADSEDNGSETIAGTGKGIMEVCCVVSAFALLDRWISCREVRPAVLEDEVRSFVRTDVGTRLGIAKVGQRATASEQSEGLRGDCRSLRLPRHALVPPMSLSSST